MVENNQGIAYLNRFLPPNLETLPGYGYGEGPHLCILNKRFVGVITGVGYPRMYPAEIVDSPFVEGTVIVRNEAGEIEKIIFEAEIK